MMEEFILLETHFWVKDNQINASTRNICSSDYFKIIEGIARILFPEEEFEIFFLPPEKWSYKDIIKIIAKNPASTVPVLLSLWALIFTTLSYKDSHEEHLHDEKIWTIDDVTKCLEFQEILKWYENDWYVVEWIDEEKINAICWNITIKKAKNELYDTMILDEIVEYSELKLVNNNRKIIKNKKIQRKDFKRYIEYVPENDEREKRDIEWIIEIVSPVLLQTKEWKWIPWKGIYYWDSIKEGELDILTSWEGISYYMQDNEFKNKIKDKSINFKNWDAIKVKFSIKYKIKNWIIGWKTIYISNVLKLNEDVFKYKEKLKKVKNNNDNILTLF